MSNLPDDTRLSDLAPRDPLMASAWLGSLKYALGREDVLAAFQQETGNTYTPPRTALEQMIDEATGAEYAFLLAFAKWHNAAIWGEDADGKPIDGRKETVALH